MRLPVELRRQILSYTCLLHPGPVSGIDNGMTFSAFRKLVPFTTVSKQFREDASFVFFSYNHFVCYFNLGAPNPTLSIFRYQRLQDLRLIRYLDFRVSAMEAEYWIADAWSRWEELTALIAEKLHLEKVELSISVLNPYGNIKDACWRRLWLGPEKTRWLRPVYQKIVRPLDEIPDFKKLKRLYIFLACTHLVEDEGPGDRGLEYDRTVHEVLPLGTEAGWPHSDCHLRAKQD
ncbi:hypothetical protein MMC26_006600 [Xylographa opegraphella]|nr:hypothetical protein [Xylographa opegraphella]